MVDFSRVTRVAARPGKASAAWAFAVVGEKMRATPAEILDASDTRKHVNGARAVAIYILSHPGEIVDLPNPTVADIFGFPLGVVTSARAAVAPMVARDSDFRDKTIKPIFVELAGKVGQPAPDLAALSAPRPPVAAPPVRTPASVPAPVPLRQVSAPPPPPPAAPAPVAQSDLTWPTNATLAQIVEAVRKVADVSENDFWRSEADKAFMARIRVMYILRVIYKLEDERARGVFQIPIASIKDSVRMMENFLREDEKERTKLRAVHTELTRFVNAPQATTPAPVRLPSVSTAPLPTVSVPVSLPSVTAPAPRPAPVFAPRTLLAPTPVAPPQPVRAAPAAVASGVVDTSRKVGVPADGDRAEFELAFDPRVTFSMVLAAVAYATDVREDEIESPSRGSEEAVAARRLVMLLLWVVCGMSDKEIGKFFNRVEAVVRDARGTIGSQIVMHEAWRAKVAKSFAHMTAAAGGARSAAPIAVPVSAPVAALPTPARAPTPAPTPARAAMPLPAPAPTSASAPVESESSPLGGTRVPLPVDWKDKVMALLEAKGAVSPGELVKLLDRSLGVIARLMEDFVRQHSDKVFVTGATRDKRYRLVGWTASSPATDQAPARATTPALTPVFAPAATPTARSTDSWAAARAGCQRKHEGVQTARKVRVMEILREQGSISPGALAAMLGVKRGTIRMLMAEFMAEESRITVTGVKSSRRYHLDGREVVETKRVAVAAPAAAQPARPPTPAPTPAPKPEPVRAATPAPTPASTPIAPAAPAPASRAITPAPPASTVLIRAQELETEALKAGLADQGLSVSLMDPPGMDPDEAKRERKRLEDQLTMLFAEVQAHVERPRSGPGRKPAPPPRLTLSLMREYLGRLQILLVRAAEIGMSVEKYEADFARVEEEGKKKKKKKR